MTNELTQAEEKTMSVKEAADYLRLSKSRLYYLTSSKKIPFYKPAGGRILFFKSDLITWIKQ